jgi:hypothetical protein
MFQWFKKVDSALAEIEISDVVEKMFVVAFPQSHESDERDAGRRQIITVFPSKSKQSQK